MASESPSFSVRQALRRRRIDMRLRRRRSMAKRSAPYQHQWVQFDGEMSMEAEIILNLALIGQGSGQFAPSCYQISEAMAQALNEKGIEAESVCADFYCINPSGLRLQKDAKMYRKWADMQTREGRRKYSIKKRRLIAEEIRKFTDGIQPYTLALFHEQQVEGDGYDGHVVVKVEDPVMGTIIIDPTFGQFNRPQHGVVLPEFAVIPFKAFGPAEEFDRSSVVLIEVDSSSLRAGSVAARADYGETRVMMSILDREPDFMDFNPTTRENIAATKKHFLERFEWVMSSIANEDGLKHLIGGER